MTKTSYEDFFRDAYEHLLLGDISLAYPSDRRGFERDLARLSLLLQTRGLPTITVDFPALAKHLDKCLSEGFYSRSNIATSTSWKREYTIPRLFRGLYLRVFEVTGLLRPKPDEQAIFFLRQILNLAKKVELTCKESYSYEAIREFYQIDHELPLPDSNWSTKDAAFDIDQSLTIDSYTEVKPNLLTEADLNIVQKVLDRIAINLGLFDPDRWRPKHGPGVVSDLDDKSWKYDFPVWSDRLEPIFPYARFAHANYECWLDRLREDMIPSGLETPSRLILVPKTQKGPRLIAAEPSAHQFCQQSIWRFLENGVRTGLLRRTVRFRDQTYNQEAVRKASISGSHWSVDLSAASDRVTCRFVERAFRYNRTLLSALKASRTRFISQTIDKKSPRIYALRKFSTMGSACTFPVESILFAGLAIASVIVKRGLRPTDGNILKVGAQVSVFGDDIVVPSDAGCVLEDLLGYLSFKVNDAKTHRNGRFRESCGVEVYNGVDVTPSYIIKGPQTRGPGSLISLVDTSNNFFMKGFWRLSDWLRSTAGRAGIAVLGINSGLFGWKSYVGHGPVKTRWNPHLQRIEFRTRKLVSKQSCEPVERNSSLLQYFTEAPEPDFFWQSGRRSVPSLKLRGGWEWLELAA